MGGKKCLNQSLQAQSLAHQHHSKQQIVLQSSQPSYILVAVQSQCEGLSFWTSLLKG